MLSFDKEAGHRKKNWPDNYYSITDSRKRKELLETELEKDKSPENQLRLNLWNKRYLDDKGRETGIDYFMKSFIDLEIAEGKTHGLFGKKGLDKAKKDFADRFGLYELAEKPEYAQVWKDEFLNFFSLYIELCRKDKSYSGVLFNLGRMSDENLGMKVRKDLLGKTVELPERIGMTEEFLLLKEAAGECCRFYFPEEY